MELLNCCAFIVSICYICFNCACCLCQERHWTFRSIDLHRFQAKAGCQMHRTRTRTCSTRFPIRSIRSISFCNVWLCDSDTYYTYWYHYISLISFDQTLPVFHHVFTIWFGDFMRFRCPMMSNDVQCGFTSVASNVTTSRWIPATAPWPWRPSRASAAWSWWSQQALRAAWSGGPGGPNEKPKASESSLHITV